jgi:hypothetical protein
VNWFYNSPKLKAKPVVRQGRKAKDLVKDSLVADNKIVLVMLPGYLFEGSRFFMG